MESLQDINKIFIAGSTGMVGSSICKLLNSKGFSKENNKLLINSRNTLDLKKTEDVNLWFKENRPDTVVVAAAKVGGILANKNNPVDFLLDNLKIQNNLIEAAWKNDVKKLLFLGSSCIYPKLAKQPIKEEYLLEGALECTNQWYAIAKISGLKLCEALKKQYEFDAISLMPTNLYGPNDNYKSGESHVIASLIKKFYEAKVYNLKEVICWGTGAPLREFLYVEDFADACFHLLQNWSNLNKEVLNSKNGNNLNWLNIGSNFEISIFSLAEKIADTVGFKGEIIWDKSKPDGTPRKKLDNQRINKFGWHAKTDLDQGLAKTFESFKSELKNKTIRI